MGRPKPQNGSSGATVPNPPPVDPPENEDSKESGDK